jgi:hypothetical protein
VSNIEENFPSPAQFLPERWLKSGQCPATARKKIHPFVSLPFGYGRRTCIGRRFAEAELHILLAKVGDALGFAQNDSEYKVNIVIARRTRLMYTSTHVGVYVCMKRGKYGWMSGADIASSRRTGWKWKLCMQHDTYIFMHANVLIIKEQVA